MRREVWKDGVLIEVIDDGKFDSENILNKVREAREIVLNRLAGIALAAMVSSDQVTINSCLDARTNLLNITSLPSVKNATDETSLISALETAYFSIVSSIPDNVKLAFRDFRL